MSRLHMSLVLCEYVERELYGRLRHHLADILLNLKLQVVTCDCLLIVLTDIV